MPRFATRERYFGPFSVTERQCVDSQIDSGIWNVRDAKPRPIASTRRLGRSKQHYEDTVQAEPLVGDLVYDDVPVNPNSSVKGLAYSMIRVRE
jgi:hypothetical protein